MSNLRSALVRLAFTTPELRGDLLPFLSKQAMEFNTPEALAKYLKDHPKAKKHLHKVKRRPQEKLTPHEHSDIDPGEKPSKEGVFSKKHNVTLRGVSEDELEKFLSDPIGKEILDNWKLNVIAGQDGVVNKNDLKRARGIRKKVRDLAKFEKTDVCQVDPKICAKNLGIQRDSMPQFTPRPIAQMLKGMSDERYKALKASKAAGKPDIRDLSDKERQAYEDKDNAEAAVAAGADPTSTHSTQDMFFDSLRGSGVKITDKTDTKKSEAVKVKDLHATQSEIRATATLKNADKYMKGKGESSDPIYVSSDGHILDGHHRWAGMLAADPNAKIPVIEIGLPMKELLQKAMEFPGVFRQDMNFNVVSKDHPIDLAREPGSVWKQGDKWYGKTKGKGAKAGGPFATQQAAKDYSMGAAAKKNASLRGKLIRLAHARPELRPELLRVIGGI